jgi:hypothetical protein
MAIIVNIKNPIMNLKLIQTCAAPHNQRGSTMTRRGRIWIAAFTLWALISLPAQAATYASNGSVADVQAKINSAANGDTVTIPSGTFDWGSSNGAVTTNKPVTLQGAGIGKTVILVNGATNNFGGILQVNTSGAGSSRVTGITFQGQWGLSVNGSTGDAPYLVDHCDFNGGSTDSITMVSTFGNGSGLFVFCTFEAGGAAEMVHNNGMGSGNGAGWSDDIHPGGPGMVYFEDCVWTTNGGGVYASGIETYYGGRTCIRYSTFNYTQIDEHGNSGNPAPSGWAWGTRWWEFYNNTFNSTGSGQQGACIVVRDGSGVMFNNKTTSGFQGQGWYSLMQDIGTAFQGNGGATVSGYNYPIYCQIGRGINQKLSPAYLWNNSSPSGTGSGSAYVNQGTDWFLSSSQPSNMRKCESAADGNGVSYSYTPYTYPHPLYAQMTVGAPGAPAAPNNLRVMQ